MAARGENGATPTLFRSVLHAMEGTKSTHGVLVDGRYPPDESVQRELQDWWCSGPLSRSATGDRYAIFYRRLVEALRGQQLLPADTSESTVRTWTEKDWKRDEHELVDSEVGSVAFSMALHAITSLWVSRVNADDNRELLVVVKKLRSLCTTGSEMDPAAAAEQEDKRPMTIAEKLSRSRSKRAVAQSSSSSIGTFPATNSVDSDGSAAVTSSVSGSTHPTESLRADDSASHYFTIETRLELRERLATLQRRLDDLLLQAKLAWMKCFAHASSNDGQEEEEGLATTTMDSVATRLVTEGESLAFHLLDAFEMARKATCPINEYKTLVATCEAEFLAFETLVNTTASAPSPVRAKPPKPAEPAETTHAAEPSTASIRKPRPAAFDLPSMKAYYDRAAPSYAAYLPPKRR